ncbi:MAG: TetR family transcriptional regulator, partial [Solirubrobacteraceae bacterium]
MSSGVIEYARRTMTRWKPDAAGRLTAAAIALFDEQGYDATTVAEIAQR